MAPIVDSDVRITNSVCIDMTTNADSHDVKRVQIGHLMLIYSDDVQSGS